MFIKLINASFYEKFWKLIFSPNPKSINQVEGATTKNKYTISNLFQSFKLFETTKRFGH